MKRPALNNFRRIVVKVGSSLLVDSDAGEVRAKWLSALVADIAKLHGEGRDVLVVSSGSIALGRSRLKLPRGPLKLEESQGAAAVGQIALARIWSEVLGAHGIVRGEYAAPSISPRSPSHPEFMRLYDEIQGVLATEVQRAKDGYDVGADSAPGNTGARQEERS